MDQKQIYDLERSKIARPDPERIIAIAGPYQLDCTLLLRLAGCPRLADAFTHRSATAHEPINLDAAPLSPEEVLALRAVLQAIRAGRVRG